MIHGVYLNFDPESLSSLLLHVSKELPLSLRVATGSPRVRQHISRCFVVPTKVPLCREVYEQALGGVVYHDKEVSYACLGVSHHILYVYF